MMTEEQIKTMINLAKRQGYIAGQLDVSTMIQNKIDDFADVPADEALAGLVAAIYEHTAAASEELKKETEAFEKELQEAAEND